MIGHARTVISPERVGTVVRLGLTPLKGAAHTHPQRITVRAAEVVGDRRWALIQPVRDGWRIVRTVETPGMTAVRARCDATGVLDLELPDGRRFLIDGDGGADGGAVVAEYWGRPAHVHLAPGPWDAALSGLLGREVQLVTVDRAGAVVFAEPVSIVTTSSVLEVARRAGDWWSDGSGEGDEVDGGVDDERFRSTLVIDTAGLPAFAEDGWVDGRLRVGAVDTDGAPAVGPVRGDPDPAGHRGCGRTRCAEVAGCGSGGRGRGGVRTGRRGGGARGDLRRGPGESGGSVSFVWGRAGVVDPVPPALS